MTIATETTAPFDPATDWTDLDRRAVDTVRVLAADAVERTGNGHPGTAMSLAPAAYLLFQRYLRHDPADADWIGRDRFVLSCGHSSLTLYIQLYLSGYGLELDDLKAFRTWGSRTPGHPELHHTTGVETTTGPLGQDGSVDVAGLAAAFDAAVAETDRPSFIQLRTIIGWPAPNLQNTGKAHGAALGADEVAAVKQILGFDPEKSFQVEDDVLAHARKVRDRGAALASTWEEPFAAW
ncbi:MAG TPA: hypothetical protein VFN19_02725, partial [Candidatus Nanopelagicales bacterium]|nr:hypothetical protein [Candidatus Nanopelagicales bacterium]